MTETRRERIARLGAEYRKACEAVDRAERAYNDALHRRREAAYDWTAAEAEPDEDETPEASDG